MGYSITVVHNGVPPHMERAKDAVEDYPEAQAENLTEHLSDEAPVESGELSESFFEVPGGDPWTRIVSSTAEHAEWANSGTGIYEPGGSGSPLTPTDSKALKFQWDKAGGMTIWKGDLPGPGAKARFRGWARSVGMIPFTVWPRGQEPTFYVDEAIDGSEEDAEFVLDEQITKHRAWY